MLRSGKRSWVYIIVGAGLVFGCIGFVEFVFWRSNRISPEFLSAAQTAYRSIRECDGRISEESRTFIACIRKAQDSVVLAKEMAKTMHEGVEYAQLHGYLNAVNDCHRDWHLPADSRDTKVCYEQLVLFRDEANKRFKTSANDRTQK